MQPFIDVMIHGPYFVSLSPSTLSLPLSNTHQLASCLRSFVVFPLLISEARDRDALLRILVHLAVYLHTYNRDAKLQWLKSVLTAEWADAAVCCLSHVVLSWKADGEEPQ